MAIADLRALELQPQEILPTHTIQEHKKQNPTMTTFPTSQEIEG